MQSAGIKRVGILRGGNGKNYNSSLRNGGDIISHINENLESKYKTFDILIDKDGTWHLNGLPIKPEDLVHKIDLAWNTTNPNFENILNNLSIPYVGIGAMASGFENSDELLRKHLKSVNVNIPRSIVLPLYQKDFDGDREKYAIKKAKEIHGKFPGPWIVKSFTPDKSMGIHLAKTFPQLIDAIEDGVKHEKSILIEEFISGKVASVHALSKFRNEDVYAFPLGNTFGKFSQEEKDKLVKYAKDLFHHLGARHYLKCDFILNKRGNVYVYGIECTPNLKPNSHFSEVCTLVGTKSHHVMEHILESVYNR